LQNTNHRKLLVLSGCYKPFHRHESWGRGTW